MYNTEKVRLLNGWWNPKEFQDIKASMSKGQNMSKGFAHTYVIVFVLLLCIVYISFQNCI